MISGKIDVLKIDKTALFQGKKGKYLDILLRETPDSKYGEDYMIVQAISKERRMAGERGPIIGNAKILGGEAKRVEAYVPPESDDGDVLF